MAIDRKQLMRDADTVPRGAPAASLRDLTARGEELEELRAKKDELDAQLKRLNERIRELTLAEIPELMEKAGLVAASGKGSFTLASGARIHLKNDLYANIKAEDKPTLFTWLRRRKLGDMIREDVHHQTLKAFCKERLEDGEDLPPMITTHFETSAVLTRAR